MTRDHQKCDFVPVTGGINISRYVRDDVDDLRTLKTDSPIDLHIVRLLQLHPALKVRFRNQDLTALDDSAKQLLVRDINDVLGIQQIQIPGQ